MIRYCFSVIEIYYLQPKKKSNDFRFIPVTILQTSPLSSLLFHLILQALVTLLSQSLNIKGNTSAGCEYKLFLYADDILAILDVFLFLLL